jgi:hypothetical protein
MILIIGFPHYSKLNGNAMGYEDERQIYLANIDNEIDNLGKRINALVARINEMKLAGISVKSQVELHATMRIMAKSLTVARAEATRALNTGENRSHRRAEK